MSTKMPQKHAGLGHRLKAAIPCDSSGELADKTRKKTQSFIKSYAEKKQIPIVHLQVCILTGPEHVWVLGYDLATHQGDIPLKELV